jgi:hypothetical protein
MTTAARNGRPRVWLGGRSAADGCHRRDARAVGVLLVVVGLLAGCRQRDLSATRDGSVADVSSAGGESGGPFVEERCPGGPWGTILWTLASGGGHPSTPAVADDGRVVVAGGDGGLTGLDCGGEVLWTQSPQCLLEAAQGPQLDPCTQGFRNAPTLGPDGTAYLTADERGVGLLFAVAPSGAYRWVREFVFQGGEMGGQFLSSATIGSGGRLFAGSFESSMYGPEGVVVAIDTAGAPLSGFPVYAGLVPVAPVANETALFVASYQVGLKSVAAVRVNGEVLWRQGGAGVSRAAGRVGATDMSLDGRGHLLMGETRLAADDSAVGSDLLVLRTGDGAELARLRLPGTGAVVGAPLVGWASGPASEMVVVGMSDGCVVAVRLTASIPTPAWRTCLGRSSAGSGALSDDGLLLVAADDGVWRLTRDGEIADAAGPTRLGSRIATSVTLGPTGAAYVATEDGTVFAWSTGGAGLDREAAWPCWRHDHRNSGYTGSP